MKKKVQNQNEERNLRIELGIKDAGTYYYLILRSLKTAYDPFIYWLNRVKIVQMAFGSVNRLLQTSGSLLMNEQTSSLI